MHHLELNPRSVPEIDRATRRVAKRGVAEPAKSNRTRARVRSFPFLFRKLYGEFFRGEDKVVYRFSYRALHSIIT